MVCILGRLFVAAVVVYQGLKLITVYLTSSKLPKTVAFAINPRFGAGCSGRHYKSSEFSYHNSR